MKTFIKSVSIITFISATLTVASIFYEGMILEWLPFVGKLILATDICFLFSTITGIFYYKKNKLLFCSHLFSVLIILIGIVIMIIFGKDIPKWLFMLWEFYILYFYGVVVVRKIWNFGEWIDD